MILNKKNFLKLLENNYKFEKKPSVVVAVSGGPDSMGLLFLLNEWKKISDAKLLVLIVNHNLRAESLFEAISVQKYLINKKIKSKILSVSKNNINKKNMNEARVNRYNLLTDYCKKNNILHLFTAHHKNDDIETFLNRKVACSDFDGLKSMAFCTSINKINIIRPLIKFSKKQIIEYNVLNNIKFILDPSNLDTKYTRPSIRKFLQITSKKNIDNIEMEFGEIKKNSYSYNLMINENLIKMLIKVDKFYVILNFAKFINIEKLISEKIIKKIYHYFNQNNSFLRLSKIQLLIEELQNINFKLHNLRGLLVKKEGNSLIFSKKMN